MTSLMTLGADGDIAFGQLPPAPSTMRVYKAAALNHQHADCGHDRKQNDTDLNVVHVNNLGNQPYNRITTTASIKNVRRIISLLLMDVIGLCTTTRDLANAVATEAKNLSISLRYHCLTTK